jgi:hypothetical protein
LQQLEVNGFRLKFKLLQGNGPEEGWVSIRLKDKELVVKTDRKPVVVAPAPTLTNGAVVKASSPAEIVNTPCNGSAEALNQSGQKSAAGEVGLGTNRAAVETPPAVEAVNAQRNSRAEPIAKDEQKAINDGGRTDGDSIVDETTLFVQAVSAQCDGPAEVPTQERQDASRTKFDQMKATLLVTGPRQRIL